LQTWGKEVVEVVVTDVAVFSCVVDTASVVVIVVDAHSPHPMQQSHEHLNVQLSKLCAQKDLHSPTLGVEVLVVLVVVARGGGIVVGADVGGVPGLHCE